MRLGLQQEKLYDSGSAIHCNKGFIIRRRILQYPNIEMSRIGDLSPSPPPPHLFWWGYKGQVGGIRL
jgi:hypothetical protein